MFDGANRPAASFATTSFRGGEDVNILSLDAAGRYFVYFMVKEPIKAAPQRRAAIGIDLGLKSLGGAPPAARPSAIPVPCADAEAPETRLPCTE